MFCCRYGLKWKKLHAEHKENIYILSQKEKDESIDALEPLQIALDDAFMERWASASTDATDEDQYLKKYANSLVRHTHIQDSRAHMYV